MRDLIRGYTRAWFDRWLKGDTSMTRALLGGTVPYSDVAVAAILSGAFTSAAALDGRTCLNLRGGC